MLSNTFNLFNFFQQPNTGKIPEKGYPIEDLDKFKVVSGKVADFNWDFPYISRTIPREIFDTNGKFAINLFSDANDLNNSGVRTPIFSNNLSGSFFKDINNSFFNLSINGKTFPHNKDLSNLEIGLSGFLKESPREFSLIKNSISGLINDFNFNFNNISQNISGNIEDSKVNFNFLKNQISGFISGEQLNKNEVYLKISGTFFSFFKDSLDIEYYIYGYSSRSIIESGIKTGDFINLNYYINSYGVGGA